MPRPQKVPNTADMVLAAQLFYKQKVPRKQIADRLNTDLRGVAWLLAQAEKFQIVNIQIHQTVESELEHQIRKLFPDVQRVLLVPGEHVETAPQYLEMQRRYAIATAKYFDELVDHHKGGSLHVGVSGGETVLEIVSAVPERLRKNLYIHVTSLMGRGPLQKSGNQIEPAVNASILWSRSGLVPGHCQYATVLPYTIQKPGTEARKSVAAELRALSESQPIRAVIDAMDRIQVAFLGISMVNAGRAPAALQNRVAVSAILQSIVSRKDLESEGAIAATSSWVFDEDGNSRDDWNFFLSAGHFAKDEKRKGLGFFKQMVQDGKKVIVAGGPFKVPGIRAALKGKMFNVLVTDEVSAQQIARGK